MPNGSQRVFVTPAALPLTRTNPLGQYILAKAPLGNTHWPRPWTRPSMEPSQHWSPNNVQKLSCLPPPHQARATLVAATTGVGTNGVAPGQACWSNDRNEMRWVHSKIAKPRKWTALVGESAVLNGAVIVTCIAAPGIGSVPAFGRNETRIAQRSATQ